MKIRNLFAGLALSVGVLTGATVADENGGKWAEGVPYHTKWEDAIKECRESGKLLLIFNGWEKKGICAPCDGMKSGLRTLAGGQQQDLQKYRKLLQERFVLLNVYCRSVKEEHDPRGPDGPYQFKDKSVPVLVIKRWDGQTLHQNLGYYSDPKAGVRSLTSAIDTSVEKNGPIVPPKAFAPLMKGMSKAKAYRAKGKLDKAWKELDEVIAAGSDKETYKTEPFMVQEAKDLQAEISAGIDEEIAKAEALPEKKIARELKRILRKVKKVEPLAKKVAAALAKLEG